MRFLILLAVLIACVATANAGFLPMHEIMMRNPDITFDLDTKTFHDVSNNAQLVRAAHASARTVSNEDVYTDCNEAQMYQFAQGYQNGASGDYDFSMCFPFFDPNLLFTLHDVYSIFGGATFQYVLQNYHPNITQVYYTVGVPPPFITVVDAPNCRLEVEILRNLSVFWPGEPSGLEINKATIQFKRLHRDSRPYNYNSLSPNNSPSIAAVSIHELPNSEYMSKRMFRRFSMIPDAFCDAYETYCSILPGVDFADKEECLAFVTPLPFSTDPDGVINPAYGKTRSCLNYNMVWVVGGYVFGVSDAQKVTRCLSAGASSPSCQNFF
jgi:hypothetical protein